MQNEWWRTLFYDKVIIRHGHADQIVMTGGKYGVSFEVIGGPEGTLLINIKETK